MSVQLDLFDLLEAPSAGAETVWEKIQDACSITSTVVDNCIDLVFMEVPRERELGYASRADRRLVVGRRGIWIDRDQVGSPDVTWGQVKDAVADRVEQLSSVEWAELDRLWEEKVAALSAFTAADVPNLYSRPDRDVLAARKARARGEYDAAWWRLHTRFAQVLGLREEQDA